VSNSHTSAPLNCLHKPLSVLGLALWILLPTNLNATAKEYQIKAAFIYNFTKFVKWPEPDFTTSNAPIVIGYITNNPFGPELENTLRGRTLHSRPFVCRHIENAYEAKQVHVLFISLDNPHYNQALLQQLGSAPVLTIAEDEGFVKSGGMIEFFLEKGKVRFNLNMPAAKRAGLSINARLQALARKPN